MELLNALSMPRGLTTFARKWLKATCGTTDSVGDCVYVKSIMVGDNYVVEKADPRDRAKMPSLGVIIEKPTAVTCKIQFLGELESLYSGLSIRDILFVGLDSRLQKGAPIVVPGSSVFAQVMGTVIASDRVLLVPNFHMVRLLG